MRIEMGTNADAIPRSNPNPANDVYNATYPTEAKWQTQVENWFKQMGGWRVYHTRYSMRSAAGFPDIVAVHAQGQRTLYVEVKTEKGKVTTAQAEWMADLANAGNEVYLWRPSDTDEAQAVLKEVHEDATSVRERGFLPVR